MADTRIGAAFIEVAVRGLGKVQSDLNGIRNSLKATGDYANQLRNALNNSPLTLALKLDKAGTDIGDEVRKQIKGLPRKHAVAIVADKIKATEAEIARLQAQLKKTPHNQTVRMNLMLAKNVKADLQKTMDGLKPSLGKFMTGMATTFSSAMNQMTESVNKIGAIATKSFFGGIAAITGFVKMADPKGFEDFEVALAKLAIQLGRFFVPLLREATEWINRLTNWFKGLSDSQRESVLLFTKIGLGIALVLMIVPKLLAAFQLISMAIAALGAETAIASGGLTVLLGVVAAAIPALMALFGAASGGGGLGGIFERVGPAIQRLVDVFKNVFQQIVQVVTQVLEKILPVVEQVFGVIAQVAGAVVNAFMRAFQILIPIVLKIVDQVASIFAMLEPVFTKVVEFVGGVLERIVAIYAQYYSVFVQVFSKVLDAVMRILPPVIDLITTLFDTVSSVLFPILDTIGEVVKGIIDALMPIVDGLLGILVPIITTYIEVYKAIIEAVKPLIQAFMEVGKILLEALLPVFQMLANVVGAAVSAVGEAFKSLAEVLVPIIRFIADVLKPVIMALAEGVRFVVNTLRDIINGVVDFMNGFIDWYNDQDLLPGKLTRINRVGGGEAGGAGDFSGDTGSAGGFDAGDDKKKKDGDKFRGEVRVPAAQLTGIAEAWKKVQTSQREDVAARIQREQLEEAKRTGKTLEEIKEKIKPADPWGGPGGDF